MKKCLPIIFAALLMVSALTGCASQTGLAQRNSSPEQNNSTAPGGETSISQPVASTTGASSPTVSPTASAAYEKLIAYKTESYGEQSIADFNTTLASTPDELTEFLAAVADVISTISSDDEIMISSLQQSVFRHRNYMVRIWEKNFLFLCHSPN